LVDGSVPLLLLRHQRASPVGTQGKIATDFLLIQLLDLSELRRGSLNIATALQK